MVENHLLSLLVQVSPLTRYLKMGLLQKIKSFACHFRHVCFTSLITENILMCFHPLSHYSRKIKKNWSPCSRFSIFRLSVWNVSFRSVFRIGTVLKNRYVSRYAFQFSFDMSSSFFFPRLFLDPEMFLISPQKKVEILRFEKLAENLAVGGQGKFARFIREIENLFPVKTL